MVSNTNHQKLSSKTAENSNTQITSPKVLVDLEKEGILVDENVGSIINKDQNAHQSLILHNSFDLLEGESHLPSREAVLEEEDQPVNSRDKQDALYGNNGVASKENVEHEPLISNKIPSCLEKRKSPTEQVVSNQQLLVAEFGRQVFPRLAPTFLVQSTLTGRRSFPSGIFVSSDTAWDPSLTLPHDFVHVLSPIPLAAPITTIDENLGPDKGKVQATGCKQMHSAASLNNFKILSKYWGDMVDEGTDTDSTMEHGTDNDNSLTLNTKDDSDVEKYLAKQYELANQVKPGRKTKKHKSPKNQVSSSSVRTRSKKGQNNNISPCVGCEK